MRALTLLLALVAAPVAHAGLPLCVEVVEAGGVEGLRALAISEVRRHPSHAPVEADCRQTLHLEVIVAGERRYLTAWLTGQVPGRHEIPPDTPVLDVLTVLVAQVLRSDPVALAEDMDAYLAAALSSRTSAGGVMLWGFEVFQSIVRAPDNAVDALPGLALRMRRELGPFTVGARGAVSFLPTRIDEGERTHLTAMMLLEPEFAWFTTPSAASSFYLGASLALTLMHFEGYLPDSGRESRSQFGVSAGVRAGVELLRTADFRLDLFVLASLPLFVSADDETGLIDLYTPSGHLGLGVAF